MIPWKSEGVLFDPSFVHILTFHWYGFIYKITNTLNGKQYIGQKSFLSFRNGIKKEASWRHYYSSSEQLGHDIVRHGMDHFTFEILQIVQTKEELNYHEVRHMFLNDVLYAKGADNQRLFYNLHIPSVSFRSDK